MGTDEGRRVVKRALVIRLGAYGDMIQTTCVFPYFTASGYEVHVHCDERGMPIIENNPHVRGVIPYKADTLPIWQLKEFWHELGRGYDHVAVLSGNVVESHLLWGWRDYMYWASTKWRRKLASRKNYYEEYIKESGFVAQPPCRGELYFTREEVDWARNLVKKLWRRKYVLLWAYAGSSIHKSYAYYGDVLLGLLGRMPDLQVVTVGGEECAWLDVDNSRIFNTSGLWSIRQSLALVPFVDLVVGPETGVLNASGCFSTPKVCLLSHSSHDNLCKYWENDYSIQAPCECSPCHRLHKYVDDYLDCPKDSMRFSLCQTALSPGNLISHIERVREETYGKTEKGLHPVTRRIGNETQQTVQPR